MTFFKRLIAALFVSILMLGATQSVMAKESEKPVQTLADVIKLNQETITAMQNGDDAKKVGALLKATKQASKSVVISGPADVSKQKAGMRIRKSRKAFRKGNTEEAIKLAEEALTHYKKAKAMHFE